jgi:DNA (cytosine-5)-methyltransferase 1
VRRIVRGAPRKVTHGSLFAGVGGFDLAADSIGMRTISASEYDPSVGERQPNQIVLGLRFPDSSVFGDVAETSYVGLGRPDVITGGSPCQGFSVAGFRKGMGDVRSGLFSEFVRIRNEGVEDGGLSLAVWENVPGALSSNNGEDFANVIAAMIGASEPIKLPKFKTRRARYAGVARGEMGFFAWRVLDARKFGVAQRRQRVFGVWSKDHDAIRVLFGEGGVERYLNTQADVGASEQGWVWFFDTDETPELGKMEADETVEVKLSQVLDRNADEKYYLSEKACLGILVRSSRRGRALPKILHYALWDQAGRPDEHTPDFPIEGVFPVCITGEVTHALKAEGFDGSEDGTGRGQPIVPVLGIDPTMVTHKGGVGEEVAPTMRSSSHEDPHLSVVPNFVGALGGTSPGGGWRFGADEAAGGQLFPVVGFSIDPASGQGADLQARETDVSQALTANWLEKATDRGLRVVERTYRVRRLTPTECERLQGFPDGWTAIAGAKDSHRYRQMGNAVAVPVAAWVMARVRAVLEGNDPPDLEEVMEELTWIKGFARTPGSDGGSRKSLPEKSSTETFSISRTRMIRKGSPLVSTPP